MCAVARDSGYNTIAFMSDAVDGRSAARCRNTIVRQNVTFDQICATYDVLHVDKGRDPTRPLVRPHVRVSECRSTCDSSR